MKLLTLLAAAAFAWPVFAQDVTPPPDPTAAEAVADPAPGGVEVDTAGEVAAMPPVAAGEIKPGDVSEAVGIVAKAVKAFRAHDWRAFAAFLLMLAVWVIRFFWTRLPKAAVPWVAVSIGVMGGLATGLSTEVPMADALWSGLLTGAGAVAAWQLVGKGLKSHLGKLFNKGDE